MLATALALRVRHQDRMVRALQALLQFRVVQFILALLGHPLVLLALYTSSVDAL